MPFLWCRREGPSPDALSFCNKTKFNMAGNVRIELTTSESKSGVIPFHQFPSEP